MDSKLAFIIVLVAVILIIGLGGWLIVNRTGLVVCGGSNIIQCPINLLLRKIENNPAKYTCPQNSWVDCQPGIGSDRPQCWKDYLDWAKTNCPDFRGVAY